MELEKTVDVLNKLVEINNDRVEGYETASKETDETDLKVLFSELATTSKHIIQDLTSEILMIGGQPIEGTTTSGKFYRVWMDIKSALTGKDRKAILNSCEFGEEQALNTYKDVLDNDLKSLNQGQKSLITAQHALLKADQNKVKYLQNTLV